MFSIGKYHELTPCIRGKELLTSFLETTAISKLWPSADHVFVSTNNGCDLFAFDVVPQLKWRRALQTKQNDCILSTSSEETIEVVWNKSEPSFIYVISKSGTTGFWEFLRPSHEWIKHKSFQLSNAKGVKIVEVKLHEETENIIWCERRGMGVESYCVCCRSIAGDTNEKAKVELGATQAILHNCPPVNIFSFSCGVCIHPCQLYLEKIYVFWTGRKDVKGVVFKDGKVEDSEVCSTDFRDIATALVGSWSENPEETSISCLGITIHPSSQDLLILNSTGVLSKLCIKSNTNNLTYVCKIELPTSKIGHGHMKDIKVFANGFVFGLVDDSHIIYLFDILSGKLLCQLEDFAGSPAGIHVLSSCSVMPATVFWNFKGIWKLECPSLNEVVKTAHNTTQSVDDEATTFERMTAVEKQKAISVNDNSLNVMPKGEDTFPKQSCSETAANSKVFGVVEVAVWLSVSGLEHSACVLMLDHVLSSLGARGDIPDISLDSLRNLLKKVLQNPVVLLALADEHLQFGEDSLNELEQFLEELDQSCTPSTFGTPLNIHILPFLRELFNLLIRQREIPAAEMMKLRKLNGESAAVDMDATLLSVTSGALDSIGLDRMEILSLQEPSYVVKAFVPVNGENFQTQSETAVGRIHAVMSEDLKNRRWKRRRNPENAVVLMTLFQPLYSEHPELLVDILDAAKKCIAEGANKDEATLQDLQECIRDFMLEFLPSAWSDKACDGKRLRIHVDILVRLGLERDAVEVFLRRARWQDAVDLYVELSRSRPNDFLFTSQLYEILLAGLLRASGTSHGPLLMQVFEMKPRNIDIRNIFELCLSNIPSSCAESVLHEGNLSVDQARKALGQFLPNT